MRPRRRCTGYGADGTSEKGTGGVGGQCRALTPIAPKVSIAIPITNIRASLFAQSRQRSPANTIVAITTCAATLASVVGSKRSMCFSKARFANSVMDEQSEIFHGKVLRAVTDP